MVRGGLRGIDLAHESADATSCLSNEESVGSLEAALALTGRAAGRGRLLHRRPGRRPPSRQVRATP